MAQSLNATRIRHDVNVTAAKSGKTGIAAICAGFFAICTLMGGVMLWSGMTLPSVIVFTLASEAGLLMALATIAFGPPRSASKDTNRKR